MSADKYLDLFEPIVEQVSDGIIFADRQGVIRLWNPGAAAIFGYSAVEVLGQSLDLIIPERFRPAHWAAFNKGIKTGETKYGRKVLTTRSMRKDGSKLYVDLSFALVKDKEGQALGAVAMARDVTSRYFAENELRRRIADLEEQLTALSAPGKSNH